MSFACACYGQNSFYLSPIGQLVLAKNLPSNNFDAFGISVAYTANKTQLGFAINAGYNYAKYKMLNTQPNSSNTEIKDERQVDLIGNSFFAGIGPSLKLPLSEQLNLHLYSTFNLENQSAKGNYSTNRQFLSSRGNNEFVVTRTETLDFQQKQQRKTSTFFKIAAGIDLDIVGVEIGWQNINYGRTFNDLNPLGKYAVDDIYTKTSQLFAGISLVF